MNRRVRIDPLFGFGPEGSNFEYWVGNEPGGPVGPCIPVSVSALQSNGALGQELHAAVHQAP